MGSGSLAAISVLESRYKDDLSKEDAIEIVSDAIQAGIFHDLGSGSNVNIFVLTPDGLEEKLHYRVFDKNEYHNPDTFKFSKDPKQILGERTVDWKDIKVKELEGVKMDLC